MYFLTVKLSEFHHIQISYDFLTRANDRGFGKWTKQITGRFKKFQTVSGMIIITLNVEHFHLHDRVKQI